VQNKEGVILIWGWAEWADIYKPTELRPISFCRLLNPTKTVEGNVVVTATVYRTDCNKSG